MACVPFFVAMGLTTYNRKRNFKRTPEPKGTAARKAAAGRRAGLSFVIQKHDASRLHYDFRLELDGVLKSWAVPKGPSLDPARKSLAVQVEDHPLDYGGFEGTIPQGQYGGGTVMLWDRGTWKPLHDPADGFAAGKLHFVLHGEKLHGEWSLVRMHGRQGDDDGKNWLLMKLKDEQAVASGTLSDVLKQDTSVKTGRSMRQIAGGDDPVWNSDRPSRSTAKKASAGARSRKPAAKRSGPQKALDASALPGARRAVMPRRLSPQLAVLAAVPPVGEEWVHEIKFDGYRILVHLRGGKAKLFTRNGKDYTAKFPAIARACEALAVKDAIFDGELVVLDEKGISDFQSLQALLKHKEKAAPTLYLFDLPYCQGHDLRRAPLIARKELLQKIYDTSDVAPMVQYSDHAAGNGDEVAEQACRMSLEGIISKRADSPYSSRRDSSWLKSKCGRRQEFVIIGWTPPQRSRKHFGALLLGYHDDDKRLVYAGRVGTGFDDRLLADIFKQLKALAVDEPPTDVDPPRREQRAAHWVKPQLVGEVRFSGWTRDGMLRHPAFVGLRTDKGASQVVREKAVDPEGARPAGSKAAPSKSVRSQHGPAKGRSAGSAASARDQGSVAGVRLSHPDKMLYPERGITKQELAEYYEQVAERVLPHVADRPLALVRCPGGRESKCFFQRNYTETLPEAVHGVDVGEGRKKDLHITLGDLAGLVSLVQVGVLEIHTWGCRNDDVEKPDQLIFDLDPGPDVAWKQLVAGARRLRAALEDLHLPTFLKTSGGKGLHLTIPIRRTIDWDGAKAFSQTIAEALANESPELFVANMRKDLRAGKIYIDYHRNGRSATAVAPYSSRARTDAPVSMPINWEDLSRVKSASQFTVRTALRQMKKPDPWRSFEADRIDLRKAVDHVA